MSRPGEFHNAQPPFYSPLNLSAEVVAPQATFAVGALASPQAVALRNPNRAAMLVDQFKFLFDPWAMLPLVNPVRTAQFQAQIMLGGIPLTNNFVPVVALCPTYNATAGSGGDQFSAKASLTWHLPRPLYVPPDVAVSAQFTHIPLAAQFPGSSFTGPMRFAVTGRSLPRDFPVPEEIYVPWATHTRCDDNSISTFTSKDKDLSNPFAQPLRVTRFIGHAPAIYVQTAARGTINEIFSAQFNPLTVRMTFSTNKILVQTDTPFYNLFTPSRRTMDVDGILPAAGFVRAVVHAPDGFATAALLTNQQLLDLSIGMIGYRVLKTPQGSWA